MIAGSSRVVNLLTIIELRDFIVQGVKIFVEFGLARGRSMLKADLESGLAEHVERRGHELAIFQRVHGS